MGGTVFFQCAHRCGGYVHRSNGRFVHDDGLAACPEGDGFATPRGFLVDAEENALDDLYDRRRQIVEDRVA